MAGAAQRGNKLNVFISYSRDDLAFADQLRLFILRDFAVTIDRESITAGEDWKKRLGHLIRDAHTIVFGSRLHRRNRTFAPGRSTKRWGLGNESFLSSADLSAR
jgi:TIR domain-containing protein